MINTAITAVHPANDNGWPDETYNMALTLPCFAELNLQ